MSTNNGSKVLKTSIIYVLVSLLNKGIGIITIPLFTRLLTTAEMGTVTTWISWMTILTPITSMSLMAGSLYIAMNEFADKRDEYQSSVLSLSTISSIICFILYLIFHNMLNKLFTLSTPLMIFMFIYLIFSPALEMWMLRQRYEYNTKKMAIVTLVSNILASIVALLLVFIFKNSSYNLGNLRLYGTYAVMGIFGIIFYINIIKKGKVLFNKNYWVFGLSISLPLIIHTLAKNVLDISDRLMISIYCGKDVVGIYGTIYSMSTMALIIWMAINNAFIPYLYDKLTKNNAEEVKDIRKMSNIMILLYAVACIVLTIMAPEIVKILTTEQYYEAIYIIPPVAAGIFLTCVYNLFANVILFHKKSIGVMFATIIAAVTNVLLNAIFIPKFGYIAAAYTTLIAYVVLSIFQGVIMVKVHRKPLYNIKIITVISIIVVSVCLICNVLYKITIIRYLIIFIVIIIALLNKNKIIDLLKKIIVKHEEKRIG